MKGQSAAFIALGSRLQDAKSLLQIHEEMTGIERGRRFGVDALNRSAVVLAVAAWEGFVEQELLEASGRVAEKSKGPKVLPESVWKPMISYLHEKKNWDKPTDTTKSAIWSFAGTGWRQVYTQYVVAKIKSLNTPNYGNVKTLYATTLGISDIATDWGDSRWTAEVYVHNLETLLVLRHTIAHGAIGNETVGKIKAKNAINLVEKIAAWTDRAVQHHIRVQLKIRGQT